MKYEAQSNRFKPCLKLSSAWVCIYASRMGAMARRKVTKVCDRDEQHGFTMERLLQGHLGQSHLQGKLFFNCLRSGFPAFVHYNPTQATQLVLWSVRSHRGFPKESSGLEDCNFHCCNQQT
eukprot:c14522_g1_i1 orf=166-528(+)